MLSKTTGHISDISIPELNVVTQNHYTN
jgi:hypothetical protein